MLTLNRSSTCVFVQATLPTCRYVVVQQAAGAPVLVSAGSFELDDVSLLAENLRNELAATPAVSRAVLLLPRGDIELNSLRLPPATDEEIPELVENLLAQHFDDSDHIHDYVVSKHLSEDSRDVLTFSITSGALDVWLQRFKEHGFKLEVITFGGIGAVHLLNQVAQHPAKTSVVVTTTDQDTDLAVVEEEKPVLFRTIPRAAGGEQFVIDQLASDIKRTLTLQDHPDDEEPRIYLIGTNDPDQTAAAKSLNEKLGLPVNLVSPFDQLVGEVKHAAKVRKPSRFANLIGCACAWNRQALEANLLAPKKRPKSPSLWNRFGFWGSVAACLLALAGYLMWEQAAEKRIELEDQQAQLQRLIKPVKKSQTKQTIVSALQAWESNEINWLDELHYLSEKLPSAKNVAVGSLTMTVAPGQRGRIKMPVEATNAQMREALEEAIRDRRHGISSTRLVDASNPREPTWRFDATISVAPLSPKDNPASAPSSEKAEVAKR